MHARWSLSIALAGLLALSALVALRLFRPDPSRPSSPPGSVGAPPGPGATGLRPPAASDPAPAPPSPPSAAAANRPGQIVGRVALPFAPRSRRTFSYQIYVLGEDGKTDGPKTIANSERFEIGDLTPGRKAVVFFAPLEELTCVYQVVTVPDAGAVELRLQPVLVATLRGKVVDANGQGVGGVTVTATEIVPLPQELYLRGKPAGDVSLTASFTFPSPSNPAVQNPAELPVGTLRIDPVQGKITRSLMTDALGRFLLPATSDVVPVPLTVSRGSNEVLKEETVLPSSGFARIVVPVQ